MRVSNDVRIKRQFRAYEKPADDINVGDKVCFVALRPNLRPNSDDSLCHVIDSFEILGST